MYVIAWNVISACWEDIEFPFIYFFTKIAVAAELQTAFQVIYVNSTLMQKQMPDLDSV